MGTGSAGLAWIVGPALLGAAGRRQSAPEHQWQSAGQRECTVTTAVELVKPVTAASVTESSENCENVEQQRVPGLRVRGWILKHILSVVDDIWAGESPVEIYETLLTRDCLRCKIFSDISVCNWIFWRRKCQRR